MSGTPLYTVHTGDGRYIAACTFLEDAAQVVANYSGGRIKFRHGKILWREGEDGEAGNSADYVAQLASKREAEYLERFERKNRHRHLSGRGNQR